MTASIASVTIIGVILAAVLIFFLRRRIMQRGKGEKAKGIPNKYNFEVGKLELQEPPLYTYDMLRNATNNFDENNKLGEGGFASVYKGILESRQVRAVKRLSTSSGQGLEELMIELKIPWIENICHGRNGSILLRAYAVASSTFIGILD
ncbi:G-type lectin S-receptor-like serine/threonine-protein kinase RKS1 [Bienertia sinuspersici]